ncbi:hypothetical protein ACFSFY_16035 [Sporosarcina siberiensis]|uniref:Uncharacterized protein n=1 Tax=Sporosarcina siberiensis TaxID=1365606 RepID=A0ABW4SJ63_9BACL
MIKKGIKFVVAFYIIITVFQWLFKPEIRWTENAGISVFLFFLFIFIEWIKKSRMYKRNDN